MIDDQLGAGCNPSNSLETSNISYNSIERDMSFQYDIQMPNMTMIGLDVASSDRFSAADSDNNFSVMVTPAKDLRH